MNASKVYALMAKAQRQRAWQITEVFNSFYKGQDAIWLCQAPSGISPFRWLAMKRHCVNHGLPRKENLE